MKNFFKFFVVFSLLALVFAPPLANAATPLQPFGGLVSYIVPCTCSGNLWIFFTPLYPAPPFPGTGALVFTPGISILHPLFFIGVPTTFHLGQYEPGVQACIIGIPPDCMVLPSLGHIFRTGTSGAGYAI